MRRVDWPDEKGYWWVMRPGCRPSVVEFVEWGTFEKCTEIRDEYNATREMYQGCKFEGPIPEPKTARFTTQGRVYKCETLFSDGLVVGSSMTIDFLDYFDEKNIVEKDFIITMEEL